MGNDRTTPKDRRKARAKASRKDKLKTEKESRMPQKEKIRKLDKPVPVGLFEEEAGPSKFDVKVRCVTCPNCGTNWCYEHKREFETDRYCQYCCYEDKIRGQFNAHDE